MNRLLIGMGLLLSAVVVPVCWGAEEDDARAAFTAFQASLKSGDPEKMWPLLDTKTQADADKAAAALKTSYGKAKPAEKTALEKAFGLTAAEMTAVSGKVYLKSKRFLGKYHEIPDSKLDSTGTTCAPLIEASKSISPWGMWQVEQRLSSNCGPPA